VSDGYRILTLDELARYPQGDALLLPVRQELGLRAFGANAWTAAVGDHVVPHHREASGDEELYVVIRGRARFTVDGTSIDATPGTLVHVKPGTEREAIAEEPDTIVLAVGATPGKAFEARGWDDVLVAFGEAEAGNVDGARTRVDALVKAHPREWQGWFNAACFEARYGDHETAFDHLLRAMQLNELAGQYAQDDSDLAPLHGDERWEKLFG
jgi:quercetin dioxygenase-like cupin family protein